MDNKLIADLFLRYIVQKEPFMVVEYCTKTGRSKEIETALLQRSKEKNFPPIALVQYAGSVVKGRWEEAEETIFQNDVTVLEYIQVIGYQRLENYEKKLLKEVHKDQMVKYCQKLNKRIPELEPSIAKSSFHNVLYYAQNVAYGRFELAEPKIIKKPKWILEYRKMLEGLKAFQDGKIQFPDEMHQAMTMYSCETPNDKNIKEYFKRYGK